MPWIKALAGLLPPAALPICNVVSLPKGGADAIVAEEPFAPLLPTPRVNCPLGVHAVAIALTVPATFVATAADIVVVLLLSAMNVAVCVPAVSILHAYLLMDVPSSSSAAYSLAAAAP